MMRVLIPLTLAASLAAPAFADQKFVPGQSEVAFTSRQMGVPVDGRFRKFDAQVAFDPTQPEAAKINITIDLGSVSLGSPEPESELVKQPWFDTRRFPRASFQSTAVKAVGTGRFEVTGKFSIKGMQRDLTVPVALTRSGEFTIANGSFNIKRLDFKIGEGEWADTGMVANDVQVRFKIALAGVRPL